MQADAFDRRSAVFLQPAYTRSSVEVCFHSLTVHSFLNVNFLVRSFSLNILTIDLSFEYYYEISKVSKISKISKISMTAFGVPFQKFNFTSITFLIIGFSSYIHVLTVLPQLVQLIWLAYFAHHFANTLSRASLLLCNQRSTQASHS